MIKSLNSLLSTEIAITTMVVACLIAFLASCSTLSPSIKDLTASTTATYKAGDNEISYSSNKNQENFKADITIDPVYQHVTGLHIETTASTPEAAIAETGKALAAAANALNNMINQIPAIARQAAQAAMAGS